MESGNDYVIQVKKNAKLLLRKVKSTILDNDPIDIGYTKELNRGRTENRVCRIYSVDEEITNFESCNTVIHILNYGCRDQKDYQENHYYISSKTSIDAEYYMKGIRGHWSIENSCHWVKDVIMNEDKSLVANMAIAENLSIVRNMVMNIYRLGKQKSIKKAIEKYCNRLNESVQLINDLRIMKT